MENTVAPFKGKLSNQQSSCCLAALRRWQCVAEIMAMKARNPITWANEEPQKIASRRLSAIQEIDEECGPMITSEIRELIAGLDRNTVKLDGRKMSKARRRTLMSALDYWNRTDGSEARLDETTFLDIWAVDGGLSANAIDTLCEQINCGTVTIG